MSVPIPAIRPLGPDDASQYRALWRRGIVDMAECFRISPDDAGACDLPTRGADDSFTLGAFIDGALIDGALVDGALVGVVSMEREALRKLRHKALVFRMFVDPQAAGAGLGRALIERLIDDAQRVGGLRQLHLTVLATNTRAIALYRSLGFTEFAREPDAVDIDGRFVDELRMVRLLRAAPRPSDLPPSP